MVLEADECREFRTAAATPTEIYSQPATAGPMSAEPGSTRDRRRVGGTSVHAGQDHPSAASSPMRANQAGLFNHAQSFIRLTAAGTYRLTSNAHLFLARCGGCDVQRVSEYLYGVDTEIELEVGVYTLELVAEGDGVLDVELVAM